jgi:hypothetical protein
MEKLTYIKLVFASYFQDMKSLDKIIKKGWWKHIPISIVFIIWFAFQLKARFTMDEAIGFQFFVLLAVPLGLYYAFEILQNLYAKARGKDRQDQFEMLKDIVASWFISSIVGVIVYAYLLWKT